MFPTGKEDGQRRPASHHHVIHSPAPAQPFGKWRQLRPWPVSAIECDGLCLSCPERPRARETPRLYLQPLSSQDKSTMNSAATLISHSRCHRRSCGGCARSWESERLRTPLRIAAGTRIVTVCSAVYPPFCMPAKHKGLSLAELSLLNPGLYTAENRSLLAGHDVDLVCGCGCLLLISVPRKRLSHNALQETTLQDNESGVPDQNSRRLSRAVHGGPWCACYHS